MGTRKRLHREAVRAGLEEPYRAPAARPRLKALYPELYQKRGEGLVIFLDLLTRAIFRGVRK